MKSAIDKCPKCGSGLGYEYMARIHMEGEWGEDPESTGKGEISRTVKCLECGHRVPRRMANTSERTKT